MPSRIKFYKSAFLFFTFSLITLIACAQSDGQICKDNYNRQLAVYNKGQFENINYSMTGCISDILKNNYYKQRRDIVFKVYKMCINAHRYLDQEKDAQQKISDLASYLGMNRDEVEKNLSGTSLTAIE